MLKSFQFRNCRSFSEKTVFSMEANYAMKDNVSFVRERKGSGGAVYLLPVAAVYGANAGGKSNFIDALKNAAENVCERKLSASKLANVPFLLTGNPDSAFEHVFEFVLGGREYFYGYSATGDTVLTETLSEREIGAKTTYTPLFERVGNEVKFGSVSDVFKTLAETFKGNKSALLLNLAGDMDIEPISLIFDWFKNIAVISQKNFRNENQRFKYFEEIAEKLSPEDKKNEKIKLGDFLKSIDPSIGELEIFEQNISGKQTYALAFWHKTRDNDRQALFHIFHESMGVQKLVELYSFLKTALDEGRPLVYDELDIMLHPLVFKRIVEMFNDKETNPNDAQLIFSAHNTIVLNREDLRRDEIFFVEKNDYGESFINRLSDIKDENGNKPRMDASYDRLYLTGAFGEVLPESFFSVRV